MGLEEHAERMGKKVLHLRGTAALWGGLVLVGILTVAAWRVSEGPGNLLAAKIEAGWRKAAGLLHSGAAQAATDPDTEGLS